MASRAEYQRIYYQEHRERINERRRQRRKQNPEKVRMQSKRYYERHRDKIAAWKKEYFKTHKKEYHVRQMALCKIPLANKCEVCGSTENLQRHHPDYDKPLEVQTLCKKCHAKVHTQLKKVIA